MFEIELKKNIKLDENTDIAKIKEIIKDKIDLFSDFKVNSEDSNSMVIKGKNTLNRMWMAKDFESRLYFKRREENLEIEIDVSIELSNTIFIIIILSILSGGLFLILVALLYYNDWNNHKDCFRGVLKSLTCIYSK